MQTNLSVGRLRLQKYYHHLSTHSRGGILKKCLNLNTKLGLIKLGLRKPRQMEF